MQTRDDKSTALHTAVRHGAVDAVKWLLDHRVELAKDVKGCTPFYCAVLAQNLELARLILSANHISKVKLIDTRGSRGSSALHCAAYQGDAEMCAEILQHAPDSILATDDDRYVPLHHAASRGHTETVKILSNSCPPGYLDLQSRWQMTALMEAVANGFPDIVDLLLMRGSKLTISTTGPSLGVECDEYNPFLGGKFTALHTAVAWQEPKSLQLLLEHGSRQLADEDFEVWVTKTDGWGKTALEIAMDLEDEVLSQMLMTRTRRALLRYHMTERQMQADSRARREQAEGKPALVWAHKSLPAAARPCLVQDIAEDSGMNLH